MTALDCFVGLLERHGRRPQVNSNGVGRALCPSHEDRNPSMDFRVADRHPGVLAICRSCGATLDQMLRDLNADEHETRVVMGRVVTESRNGIEREFIYHDATGQVCFRVVRRPPREPGGRKRFVQQPPDGNGGWLFKREGGRPLMDGVPRVPYRLPEVLRAIERGEVVLWFAEGEKNVDDLVAIGLEATCNPGGALKWRDDYARMLTGLKRAVICVDNDPPGEDHARDVAASLTRTGVHDIVLLRFGGADGFDVSDWLHQQPVEDRKARLIAYLEQHGSAPSPNGTPPAEPGKPGTASSPRRRRPLPLTDTGNAERLVARHGHELRYVEAHKSWLVWNGVIWKVDAHAAMRLSKKTARSIYAEAADVSDAERKAFAHWAMKSESSRAREAMVSLARSELVVELDDLDTDPWALNVENGIVDLKTGTLKPHHPDAMMTKLAPARYDPDARHELWDRFLDRMVPDLEVREFLQRAAGYTLTGDTSEEKLFFIHGPTASGKSTFIAALKAVMGSYSETCDFETFLDNNGRSAETELARLTGTRMAVSLEVDEGKRLAVGLVKSVTGRDAIAARHLYAKTFTYTPAFKLWLVANDRPRASASDNALWRRILMVPFEESLATEEQDPTVKTRLTTDPAVKAAVLAWAVQGTRLWLDEGLRPSKAVEQATADYRSEQDTIGDFLTECCVFGVGLSVRNPDIWKAYIAWAQANGERPMSATMFGKRMKHHGVVQQRTSKYRSWYGIRLKDAAEQTQIDGFVTQLDGFEVTGSGDE